MIIWLAIGPLICVSLLRFMPKETSFADTVFLWFCKLNLIWFEDGFTEVNINLSKWNFRWNTYKITFFFLHLQLSEKIVKFHCVRFFFVGYIILF